jgi:DMSO/TMAO reductase YedYZ molybdopterin-dependent catalytic subunit
MNKKRFLTLTIIILTTLALTVYNSKLPATQAQTSNTTALTITGLVQNPLSLTLNDIEAMPQTTEYAILICVSAPTIPLERGNWTGVQLSYLLQQANVSSDAVKVAMFAPDGFEADLTVQMATQDSDILVAYQLNNISLKGLQLVVPNNYGYKWISDLTQIQLVNYNFLGTEESAGYPDDATITAQSGTPTLPNQTLPPQATPTQSSTPTPTASPQSPLPTSSRTTTPATSSPKPQSTSTFLIYIATVSVIVVVAAVVSAVTLIKRKKVEALKREEAARAPSSL